MTSKFSNVPENLPYHNNKSSLLDVVSQKTNQCSFKPDNDYGFMDDVSAIIRSDASKLNSAHSTYRGFRHHVLKKIESDANKTAHKRCYGNPGEQDP